MLIFNHKSKDIAPYLVYTNDDNFILDKDDIGADVPDPSDTVPAMDGIGAIGESTKYARADHVHPSDSGKAAVDHVHGYITNSGGLAAEYPEIATGDYLVINDVSKDKIANGIAFEGDRTKFLRSDGKWFVPGLVFIEYGKSTWNDFLTAYNKNCAVYCRASSNANPATGAQNRLAFMAYVNDVENPTNVEFQYYRSVTTHSASQQGDQVFVYKLDKTAGWTVTTREASSKIAVSAPLASSYSSGTLTLSQAAPQTSQDADSVTVPTSTNTNLVSKKPGKGVWAVCGKVTYPNNATGRRAVKLSTVSEEPNNVISTVVQNAVTGSSTQMSTTRIFTLGANDYIYLVGWQNSGGDLTCSAGIELTQLA